MEQAQESGIQSLNTGRPLGNPPNTLDETAIKVWNWVVEAHEALGCSDFTDTKAVEMFCLAFEEYMDLKEIVREEGRVYESATNSGELRYIVRPEVLLMEKAWVRARSLLPELCLTTAARVNKRTAKVKGKGEKDLEDILAGL